jgi:hypothetical protein
MDRLSHETHPIGVVLIPGNKAKFPNKLCAYLDDIGGLGPPGGSLYNIKLHLISFLEALKAFRLDGGVMNEHIRAAVSPDKPKAFRVVKPLDRACELRHRCRSPCLTVT